MVHSVGRAPLLEVRGKNTFGSTNVTPSCRQDVVEKLRPSPSCHSPRRGRGCPARRVAGSSGGRRRGSGSRGGTEHCTVHAALLRDGDRNRCPDARRSAAGTKSVSTWRPPMRQTISMEDVAALPRCAQPPVAQAASSDAAGRVSWSNFSSQSGWIDPRLLVRLELVGEGVGYGPDLVEDAEWPHQEASSDHLDGRSREASRRDHGGRRFDRAPRPHRVLRGRFGARVRCSQRGAGRGAGRPAGAPAGRARCRHRRHPPYRLHARVGTPDRRGAAAPRAARLREGRHWKGRLPAEEVDACESLGISLVFLDTVLMSSTDVVRQYDGRR